jgi:hypothetical protein
MSVALNKMPVNINFAKGLDTKTDPYQVAVGNFLSLENSIFTKAGLLQKRNGFGNLSTLPQAATFLTTFNDDLTAIGSSLQAYSQSFETWVNKGALEPVTLSTLPLIRSNTNQKAVDSAVSPNGLVCTVYTDVISSPPPVSAPTIVNYKYVMADSTTGQNIIPPTVITTLGSTQIEGHRVFVLGQYFVIVFTTIIGSTPHLQYVAISYVNPTIVTPTVNITSQYIPSPSVSFDGVVLNGYLYLAWAGSDIGGAIRITKIDSTLVQANTVIFSGQTATLMSVVADINTNIYVSFYDSISSNTYILCVNGQLSTIFSPVLIVSSSTILNITSITHQITSVVSTCEVILEHDNTYSYDSSIHTSYITNLTVSLGGVPTSETLIARSVGLASKAFIWNNTVYFLTIYSSAYQPTYFLMNDAGQIVAKLAYSNASQDPIVGPPSVSINGNVIQMAYLYKDLIQAVNKSLTAATSSPVYSQTGINLVSFNIGSSQLSTAEIGSNLNISGGFLWMYDGYVPTEQGFHLWPDYVEAEWSATGGNMAAQPLALENTNVYCYQVTYEWTDNQGNAFRSAPSIPVFITTTGTGVTGSVTLNIPTLRLTYKIANPVKIVIYRWSVAQQNFFQVTSITAPLLNDMTVDSITYVDTLADSAILGNNLIYTTGGVLEDIGPPSTQSVALFQSRLFMVDAEDPNLLWFSKQVIEDTPVEMSDLLTIYVPPTIGAQGSTGNIRCLAAMDDKLILFKQDALYYINGTGPDNTGANNQFSDAIYITSNVGSANQQSIVLMPQGLMFQSDKGIWLLGRDLSTQYIGAPVEKFTLSATVLSAIAVPGTNQVRFTMDSGITLMYDYYYGQWGTFINIPALSSTIYQSLHTYIDQYNRVKQETPGAYLDGATPVLMSFTTSWLNIAGLQGYERAYFFYLLGTYLSPHKLALQIAYDYNASPTQQSIITPDNQTPNWGGDNLWGSGQAWGGPGNVEPWRVFLQNQKCQALQITMNEQFDPAYGTIPGAGLTLSGINLIVGLKKGYRTQRASRYVG